MSFETHASGRIIHKGLSFFGTASPIPRLASARNRLVIRVETSIILAIVRIISRICQTGGTEPSYRFRDFSEEDVLLVSSRSGQIALTSVKGAVLGIFIAGDPGFVTFICRGIRYISIVMVVTGEVVNIALRGGHVGTDAHAVVGACRDTERDVADKLLYLSGSISLREDDLPRIIGDSHLLETAASGIHV